ncbi:helix-turn-helix transcriptional regulator [Roseospira visakhapatnamensis]|uniref:DNA-binding CsgD family transcriptional regulator n=1 Tax=Roseospira visakhapatnamensis TaxID=390880 RepID=A0A7W6RE70_9PROT|nr:LuxR C-terminal-related transcriptional regulator [Roseospira visakhapatnamensis]MBB4266843.1 DNA-binding CsgD family transcriptional regulator [Roseospira visakhapatnamensis]
MLCDEGLDSFLDELESADTLEGLWTGVVAFFADRHVDGVVHAAAPTRLCNGSATIRILDSLDGAAARWCANADAGGIGESLGPLLVRRRPDLVDLRPAASAPVIGSPGLDRILAEHGFRAALVLPLPRSGSVSRRGPTGLLLLSRKDAAAFRAVLRADGACLVLAASHAHDRLLRLADSDTDTAPPSLTNREGEVLTLSARGLTTRELGQHMGISISAVNFHLANAGRKLSATNRTHAVSRAIALGLIMP